MSPGRSFFVTSSATRPLGLVGAEVHHHRDVGERARLHRVLHRRPLRAAVVRGLDADDHARVLLAPSPRSARPPCPRGPARTAPPRMPLPTMLRKASTRVFERSITRVLKSSKLRQPAPPASTTVVTPTRKREAVGVDAVVAGVGALLAGARVDVGVDVDQAGRDVEAGDVDRLEGLGGIDLAARPPRPCPPRWPRRARR